MRHVTWCVVLLFVVGAIACGGGGGDGEDAGDTGSTGGDTDSGTLNQDSETDTGTGAGFDAGEPGDGGLDTDQECVPGTLDCIGLRPARDLDP